MIFLLVQPPTQTSAPVRLPMPNGHTVRLPQPAGYAALKMRSWIDRLVFHDQDRDAKDLALVAYWYQKSEAIKQRLDETDDGFRTLTELDMDADLAAVRLLSPDTAVQLSPANCDDLARRWAEQDMASQRHRAGHLRAEGEVPNFGISAPPNQVLHQSREKGLYVT